MLEIWVPFCSRIFHRWHKSARAGGTCTAGRHQDQAEGSIQIPKGGGWAGPDLDRSHSLALVGPAMQVPPTPADLCHRSNILEQEGTQDGIGQMATRSEDIEKTKMR